LAVPEELKGRTDAGYPPWLRLHNGMRSVVFHYILRSLPCCGRRHNLKSAYRGPCRVDGRNLVNAASPRSWSADIRRLDIPTPSEMAGSHPCLLMHYL
jgi:hypothetical protein